MGVGPVHCPPLPARPPSLPCALTLSLCPVLRAQAPGWSYGTPVGDATTGTHPQQHFSSYRGTNLTLPASLLPRCSSSFPPLPGTEKSARQTLAGTLTRRERKHPPMPSVRAERFLPAISHSKQTNKKMTGDRTTTNRAPGPRDRAERRRPLPGENCHKRQKGRASPVWVTGQAPPPAASVPSAQASPRIVFLAQMQSPRCTFPFHTESQQACESPA